MTTSRRSFLQRAGLIAGAFSAKSIFNTVYAADVEAASKRIIHLSPEAAAEDEDYWSVILVQSRIIQT